MANTVIFNGTGFKSAQAKVYTVEDIVTALKEKFGKDNVTKVGSNKYGIIIGQVQDKDGFPQDLVEILTLL